MSSYMEFIGMHAYEKSNNQIKGGLDLLVFHHRFSNATQFLDIDIS